MAIAIEKTKTTFGRAAIMAGVIAGTTFLALEMLFVPLFTGDNAWAPVRMIAAIIMGENVLPETGVSATYSFAVMLVALVLHFTLSIIYSSVIGMFCRVRNMSVALGIGAVAGLTIYLINFYGFTALFPWFAMARNWISVFAHLVFGMVAAYSFVKIYYPFTPSGKTTAAQVS